MTIADGVDSRVQARAADRADPAQAAEVVRGVQGDKPLWDWSRLTFAGGMNYVWHAAPFDQSAPVPPFGKEWEVGLYASYNLTPHLSLAGSTVYGFDNKLVQDRIGLRVRFGSGEK